jgi:hypothetical protein
MQGMQQEIAKVLNVGSAYSIPPYQRAYSWGPERWQGLIQDVLRVTTSKETDPDHWLGILLVTQEDNLHFPGDDSVNIYSVIDGQQRIVSLVIWLSALAHHAKDNRHSISFEIENISKLYVQISDQVPLKIVIENKWLSVEAEPFYGQSAILDAYYYFRFLLWLGEDALLEEQPLKFPKFPIGDFDGSIQKYWQDYVNSKRGLELPRGNSTNSQELIDATRKKLNVYTLIHDPNVDESQSIIFNTLNGMRVELEPLDHVRNSIFVRMKSQIASEIYEKYWKPAEDTLLSVNKKFDPGASFLYDYLIGKLSSQELKNQGTITKTKGQIHFAKLTRNLRDSTLGKFIEDDLTVAMHCWPLVVREVDQLRINSVPYRFAPRILELLTSIREMSDGPANPLALYYVQGRVKGEVENDEQLIKILSLIENYIARKILALEGLSPLRSRIMQVCSNLDGSYDYDSLEVALVNFGWNTDKEIKKDFRNSDFSSFKLSQVSAILRGIERKLSGAGSHFWKFGKKDYTIEHIYPREDKRWITDLEKWETTSRRMEKFRETLGNLTVVYHTHNSAVGNKPLKDKQEWPQNETGRATNLKIHSSWINSKRWTENEISERSEDLLESALNYWKDISVDYEK